jgi:hypothetical protein
VFIQEGEHIGFPDTHAEIEKTVPVFDGGPDRRIDLEEMRLAELLEPGVQSFAVLTLSGAASASY